MSETPVTANLNETFNVKVSFFSELTLNTILPVNKLAETVNLIFSKVVHFDARVDASLSQNLLA
jgi:hypothetical protein